MTAIRIRQPGLPKNAMTPPTTTSRSKRRFFLWMALAIAATVVAGFGRAEVSGRVSWAALPAQVYLHGLLFAAWTTLLVVQSLLVGRGSLALHRQLGVFGALLAMVMVPTGIALTVTSIQRDAVPPFFEPGFFLVLNAVHLLVFGGLIAAGIALRKRPEWHRRLMLCGTIVVMVPAVARLLPMRSLGAFGHPAITTSMLLYVVVGMAFDLVTRRRIHAAWWVGVASILAMQIAIGPIALSPPVRAIAARLLGESQHASHPAMSDRPVDIAGRLAP